MDNELENLEKAVRDLFDRAKITLVAWEGNAHLLHGPDGPIGNTVLEKTAKAIERCFTKAARRMP